MGPANRSVPSTGRGKFSDPAVTAVFESWPPSLRRNLLALRALIFEAAAGTPAIGRLVETLKWGQPSYLPAAPRIGTTVRIDALRAPRQGYAIYFHCQTSLVEAFRARYAGLFRFEGNRALVFEDGAAPPREALRHCIAMALSYHLDQRKRRAA